MQKVLKEQYTEGEFTFEQLCDMLLERMRESRKKGYIIERITQTPVYDGDGNVVGIRTDFPAELNIYVMEED